MAISEQVLHPGVVVETIKAPLPFGIPDTPENRATLAAALAASIAPDSVATPATALPPAAPAPVSTAVQPDTETAPEQPAAGAAVATLSGDTPAPASVADQPTPAGTTTGAVVDACTAAASTTWDWAKCAGRVLNGLRTLLFFGIMAATAILAKLEAFDLSGLVTRVSGKQIAAEDIMLFMSTAGIVLRFVTSTPVFERWRKAAQGDKQEDASSGLDDGDVG